MSGRPRRRRLSGARLVAIAAIAAVAAAGCVLTLRAVRATGPGDALSAFAMDWSEGRDREAAERTDAPRAATRSLKANRDGLDGARVQADPIETQEEGRSASGRLRITWRIPNIGEWRYQVRVPLRKDEGGWVVRWRESLVHPKLDRSSRLGTTRVPAERGEIRGRDGTPLVTGRPVVRVGAVAGRVKDPRRTASGLAAAVGVDARPFLRAISGGGEQQFVEAIALRPADYAKRRAAIGAVPDQTTIDGEAQLAPSKAFARALLGAVGPVTAEQLKELGPRYATGDEAGQWGLQAKFEERLAGRPERRVVIRARGVPIETLARRGGRPGRALKTTLDLRAQSAAESALAERRDEAAIVVVQPSTGDILAVANRPVESTYDRALEGRYPPGSTFKVVSTAALLEDGLGVDDTVPCPKLVNVGGKPFKNFEGNAAGAVPFRVDFAESCNTAFVSLADRLPRAALHAAGRQFGLGERLGLAMPAAEAQVPPGRTRVEHAAAMIGQHRILASPLQMAGVAATVAAGGWRAPRLLASDPRRSSPAPDASTTATLRELMRAVVTSGTGVALSGVPGVVHGKSGTAEYGGGNPPPTHAWFIAYRGDLALSVLVENGPSGGSVAAPIAARFFEALAD